MRQWARCFARFVFDQGLTDKHAIRVETAKGIITPVLTDNGLVTVDMGQPRLLPVEIPFEADADAVIHPLTLPDGAELGVTVVSMGNPHAVQVVDDVNTAPVATHGPQIEQHARFPQRVNAGFMQVLNRQKSPCACTSAALAKPWPAALAPVRPWWPASAVACWTPPSPCTPVAAICASNGPAPASRCRMTGPAVTVYQGGITPLLTPPARGRDRRAQETSRQESVPMSMTASEVGRLPGSPPRIFDQHSELLTQVRVPHARSEYAVPLVERQVLALRDKTASLAPK